MNRKYFKLLITITLSIAISSSYLKGYHNFSTKYKIDSKILKLWSPAKVSFKTSIGMLKESPIELYFIGSESYNLLYYAFAKNNTLLIDELLQIYMQTLPYIKEKKTYNIYEFNKNQEKTTLTLTNPIYIWSNKEGDEELISSAQFLFVLSFAFNKITTIANEKRSTTMNYFINEFAPILSNHYQRWVIGVKSRDETIRNGSFSRRGWGCKDNQDEYIYARTLNQMIEELGKKSYHGASYCNIIADPSLLIISGLGYYLAGTKNQYPSYTIPNEKILENFLIKSVNVVSKQFKKSRIRDVGSKPISILTFQEGAWNEHPDYYYSDYSGSSFPQKKNRNCNSSIGRDVAHGSRLLYLLEMLAENKDKFQIEFPRQDEMEMFTNAFFYNIFNQNVQQPLFKNYMNGSNGWFRVNYESRKGYGYPPYSIGSEGALLGGYPRLAKYNKNLETIFEILFIKFNSSNKEDRAFIHQFYEKSIWIEGKQREVYHFYDKKLTPKTAIYLINFYSSLI
ncbi:MAG: hypothetical protein DSZ07_08405 [Sulfurovum sp.]|nr:MAG: hypothetical protein DSZ07_08405 [Sulfurovum sp.]